MHKKLLILCSVLVAAVSAAGCGNTHSASSLNEETVTTVSETTQPSTETQTVSSSERSRDRSYGFGMMKYIKKSKQATANADAATICKVLPAVLADNEKKLSGSMIYSNTGVGELNKDMRETYYEPPEAYDYIIFIDDKGYPDKVVCSKSGKTHVPVGVYGFTTDEAESLQSMTWAEVLEKYGFESGKYSNIKLLDDKRVPPTTSTNIKYEGLERLDLLALTIGWEYNLGVSGKPLYVYGLWGSDEPFTADLPWEFPEHGDTEFVIEFTGAQIGRVMCWEQGTDKSEVGMVNIEGERYYLSDSSWDEILEYFGYTQGEYVDFMSNSSYAEEID